MLDDASPPAPAESEPATSPTPEDPTVKRFKSCRWHDKVEGGAEYCSHRDVLPYAGRNGFSAKAWCPDCAFYKVRRTVKRRDQDPDLRLNNY